jgi:hypothetical protein
MASTPHEVNWREIAAEYRKRLHSMCVLAAFGVYIALGVCLGKLLEALDTPFEWIDEVSLFAWLPLGLLAFWARGRLIDWSDKDMPAP